MCDWFSKQIQELFMQFVSCWDKNCWHRSMAGYFIFFHIFYKVRRHPAYLEWQCMELHKWTQTPQAFGISGNWLLKCCLSFSLAVKSPPVTLVLQFLFHCYGPASRAFIPHPLPLFKTSSLLFALHALYFSPEDLLSPKSFLRGYTKYSKTHVDFEISILRCALKSGLYLSCIQTTCTNHFWSLSQGLLKLMEVFLLTSVILLPSVILTAF